VGGAPISIISHAGMGEPLTDRAIHDKIAYEKGVFPDARGRDPTPMPSAARG